jgi:thymidylate synthase ThyX
MYNCKILLDSINTSGDRLTTFELTYPRIIHSELLTHKMLSKNSSSSRAIPIEKMIEQVENDPVIPVYWGKNQKGMQAEVELDPFYQESALRRWLSARDEAVVNARALIHYGVHKQIVNRLMEPWMWITVLVSATEYNNFFNLRCHKDAQPEIAKIAWMMLEEYKESKPRNLNNGQWHLPLLFDLDNPSIHEFESLDPNTDLRKISVGRCARVSYLTHEGKRNPQADIDLHNRLITSGHWSPFEHVAMASPGEKSGNFTGWHQYRKDFPNENRTILREELR